MKKSIILILIMFLLSISSVIALGEYYNPSYETYTINGLWKSDLNTGLVSENYISTTNTPSWHTPLVGDLDNNGNNEIVIIDGSNVEIYRSKTLTAIAGRNAEDNIQHAILYDIDGDNTLEVLTVGGDKFSIFDYNTTGLYLTSNYTIPNTTGATRYQFMIGCKDTNDCLIINARDKDGIPSTETIIVSRATSTGIYNETTIKTSINNGDYTLPKIREVSNADMTLDGDSEFVFSAYDTGNIDVCYWYISTSPTGITEDLEKCVSSNQLVADTGEDDFTSPLIIETDPTSSGYEIVMAFQDDSQNEFAMYLYSSAGVELQDYPELTYTQGTIISNPVQAQVFTDTTGNKDFCVLGYWSVNDELKLLCGSPTHSELLAGEEFDYDNLPYALSETDYFPNTIIHSVQVSATTTDGVNLNEFVTPFGIFNIDFLFLDNKLTPSYLFNTVSEGIAIPTDTESTGYFDIVYQTENGVYYLDDGFVNTQTSIKSLSMTPNPLCYNRTYTIIVSVEDKNNDLSTCYIRTTDEFGNSLQNLTNKTGLTSMSFYYTPVTNGIILLTVNCTDNISPVQDSETKQLEVRSDTSICNDPSVTAVSTNYVTTEQETENAEFDDDVDELLDGILVTSTKARNILGLVLMLLIAIGVYVKTKSDILAGAGAGVGVIISWMIGILTPFPAMILGIISILIIIVSIKKGVQ